MNIFLLRQTLNADAHTHNLAVVVAPNEEQAITYARSGAPRDYWYPSANPIYATHIGQAANDTLPGFLCASNNIDVLSYEPETLSHHQVQTDRSAEPINESDNPR